LDEDLTHTPVDMSEGSSFKSLSFLGGKFLYLSELPKEEDWELKRI
jgi:hypothetical protein